MREIKTSDFSIIKEVAKNISEAKKKQEKVELQNDLPSVLGLKLTNVCNLRCKHCYEWNENGYHHNMSDDEKNKSLDFSIVKKCLDETKSKKSMVYLWGGEPFLYPEIKPLLERLCEENRTVAICTNSIKIPEYIDTLCKFSDKLELLLALEGDKESNDELRGKGNYHNTISIIKMLLDLRANKKFNGKISVHTMISNENANNLYGFVQEMENLHIDNLTLCFPWYISNEMSESMDLFYNNTFSWLNANKLRQPSWHAYKYNIDPSNVNLVCSVVDTIRNHKWKINVNILPNINGKIAKEYMLGRAIDLPQRPSCLTVFSRMDVLPTGKVSACKHFQELTYGDLNVHSVFEVWNSTEMNLVRRKIKEGLMPICNRCNNLYLHSYDKGMK